jgi:hypothetical protein
MIKASWPTQIKPLATKKMLAMVGLQEGQSRSNRHWHEAREVKEKGGSSYIRVTMLW